METKKINQSLDNLNRRYFVAQLRNVQNLPKERIK